MTPDNHTITRVVEAIYEADSLRGIDRSHRQVLLTRDSSDNIAAHKGVTANIGWYLATLENANPYIVVAMIIFHDDPETRTGDQNWLHKRYVASCEEEVRHAQISGLPKEQELFKLTSEYDKRQSLEAIVAKDSDTLHQIVLLRHYAHQGNMEAKRWLKNRSQIKQLQTENGKLIAQELYKTEPNCWWKNLSTPKRRTLSTS